MSDISDITILVRYLIQDHEYRQIPGDIFTYTGSSSVFTLSESNVTEIVAVYKNGSALSVGSYTFDSTTSKLTISSSLTNGDTIEVQYKYYPNYSDSELEAHIRAANVFLSVNNYYTFTVDTADNFYPDITDKERNLLAFVTSILIKPDNRNIRLPDMTITVPNSLPTRDLVSKAVKIFKHNTHGNFELT